jgi:hypothetical protein
MSKSKMQQRYFDYLESKGKLPKKPVDDHEYEDSSPEGYAYGGMVEDKEENYDYEMGHEEEYDSSGEPHTEDEPEDKHPMEYMAYGGKVKRMNRGGMASRPAFAQALRKKMY